MVLGPNGSKCERTNIRLAGPVSTLLQLAGIPQSQKLVCVSLILTIPDNVSSVPMHYLHTCALCCTQALADCTSDLLAPFLNDTIDLVAGIDAMGFILGIHTDEKKYILMLIHLKK